MSNGRTFQKKGEKGDGFKKNKEINAGNAKDFKHWSTESKWATNGIFDDEGNAFERNIEENRL